MASSSVSLSSVSLAALVKNLVFCSLLCYHGSHLINLILIKGPGPAAKHLIAYGLQKLSSFLRKTVPGANRLVNAEVQKNIKSMQSKIVGDVPGEKKYKSLPAAGLDPSSVRSELTRYQKMGHVDWKAGKVSGAIYHGGDEVNSLITDAFGMFCITNPLHPEIFPGIRKMEAEVVSMVLRMFNAPSDACGSITSGGTESILMAIKAYRELAKERKGITEPEMLVPVTVHAAFDKGANYFGVKLIHIPVDPHTGAVDVKKMERAINSNTIMIAGSAPNFPSGIIDNIPALGQLAKKYNVPLHVDCCLGGFLVPFAEKAGYPLPFNVDFRVDGVTSISCDTHKYGFAPKGSSVIMYRTTELRNYQYFITTEWPGGVYASPSIAGSRPGALIAGCWAAMLHFGESGYVDTTKKIIGAARTIQKGLQSIKGIRVMGNPVLSVVAFEAEAPLKVYAVADLLSRKGWHLNMLQNPNAVHIACTYLTVPAAEEFVNDVKEAVETLRKDPKAGNGDLSAIYGTAASVPDRSIIADVTRGFLDSLTML